MSRLPKADLVEESVPQRAPSLTPVQLAPISLCYPMPCVSCTDRVEKLHERCVDRKTKFPWFVYWAKTRPRNQQESILATRSHNIAPREFRWNPWTTRIGWTWSTVARQPHRWNEDAAQVAKKKPAGLTIEVDFCELVLESLELSAHCGNLSPKILSEFHRLSSKFCQSLTPKIGRKPRKKIDKS